MRSMTERSTTSMACLPRSTDSIASGRTRPIMRLQARCSDYHREGGLFRCSRIRLKSKSTSTGPLIHLNLCFISTCLAKYRPPAPDNERCYRGKVASLDPIICPSVTQGSSPVYVERGSLPDRTSFTIGVRRTPGRDADYESCSSELRAMGELIGARASGRIAIVYTA